MTKDQLVAKLADLEWEDFEVKAAKGGLPKDTWETVSAFSNTSGGWLLFGVRQHGKQFEVQGLSNPERTEQDFLNTIRSGKLNVFVPTRQAKHNIEGKTVLAFYVPVSRDKPVYYSSLQNTFIRRGSSDQRATREEIDAMFRDQTFGTKTSELAPETSKGDLHKTSLKQYRDYMARFNPDVSYNRYEEDEFLTRLRIVDNEQLTYAGLLFLGKRESIEKHFPDFRIDLLEIPGTSITDATTNYTFRLDEYENLWDYYFACFQRLKQKVDVAFQISNQGFGQELSPGLKTIREALVNMLMHADYFAPAHSRIRIFTSHIEFYNPGGLPKPLEELKAKDLSLPRNPLISKLFRMVRLAENAGYGFDKIDTNWEQYNHTTPEYDISFDATILKLYIRKEGTVANTSGELRRNFREISENLQAALIDDIIDKELILHILNTEAGKFIAALASDYSKTSEKLRRNFGEASEKLLRGSSFNTVKLLMLIEADNTITAERASNILGVSSRTIETYIAKLKESQLIERQGSDKEGTWSVIKE